MHRSPSLEWSEGDRHSPIQRVKLFDVDAPQQILPNDYDIESGESTVSESGWSDTESDSDLTPAWDPVSLSGPIRSSPVIESDPEERAAHRRQKGYKKWVCTLAGNKEDK